MDPFKKHRMSTFNEIEREFGRMLRNMSTHRMFPYRSENLIPSCDVYETEGEFIIYMEVPGIDSDKLSVIVNHSSVTVTGERAQPVFDHTTCIHQLEVEYGRFKRTLDLESPIDAEAATSSCKNGFLLIRLPKKKSSGHIKVSIKSE